MQTPITRCSALRTGGIAAIVAGLSGADGTPASTNAAPLPAPVLAHVVSANDLVADSLAALAEYSRAMNTYLEVSAAFRSTLTHEQETAYLELDTVKNNLEGADSDMMFAELVRHLPGLAPVLWMLRTEHCLYTTDIGTCCT